MSEIASDVEDGIALIRLMRPGEGALTPDVRADVIRALNEAEDAPEVKGVVLTGTGAVFCSGLDLREYDQGLTGPTLRELTQAIENHSKPVVVALNGPALEAGFEIALAAHARVARAGVKVALPQVSLGMVPAGGATQRLPRLTGARSALEMLLKGRTIAVEDPRLDGLFDRITEGLPLRDAQDLARRLAETGSWTPTSEASGGLSDPAGYEAAIRTAHQAIKQVNGVEADIVRAVEAALLLPFEQGLDLEVTASEEWRTSAASRARRHLFAADRLAARAVAGLQAKAHPTDVVAVVSGGARGVSLAASSLEVCEEVILYAPDLAEAEDLAKAVDAVLSGLVRRGVLSAEACDTMIERLSLSDDPEVLREADLVFDAGTAWDGPIGVAQSAVWCLLDEGVSPTEQARRTGAETLGLNPYRPAHPASMVELQSFEETPPEALATTARFFSRMGRTVLMRSHPEPSPGLHVSAPLYMAALVLARHGADPQALEDGARHLGFARGVLDMIDREGADHVLAQVLRVFPGVPGPDWLDERLVFMNRNWPGAGALCSAGPEGPAVDPDLPAWLAGWRQRSGIVADLPDVSIPNAVHAAVVNHVARMIRTGRIEQPVLADLCLVRGFGLARDRGGLLFQADQHGLLPLLRAMKRLAPVSELWTPDPLIEDMVKHGAGFFDPPDEAGPKTISAQDNP